MRGNQSPNGIPVPGPDASQLALIEFALTYDGYRHLRGGPTEVSKIADPVIERFRRDQYLPDDLDLLRVTLFWLQRTGHNQEQMDRTAWVRSKSIWQAIVDKISVLSGGFVEAD